MNIENYKTAQSLHDGIEALYRVIEDLSEIICAPGIYGISIHFVSKSGLQQERLIQLPTDDTTLEELPTQDTLKAALRLLQDKLRTKKVIKLEQFYTL